MPRIPDDLRRLAARQDGLVTRPQAVAAGLTRHQIDWLTRPEGRWTRVLRGVYSVTSGALVRRQQMRAGLLYAGSDAVLTGLTVLELLDVAYAPRDPRVHCLVPITRRVHGQPALVIQRTQRLPEPRMRDRLPMAPVARAAVDAARRVKPREARALLAEVVQRRLCTLDMLRAEVDAGPRRFSASTRRALSELGGGAASAPELDLIALCEQSALLPPPRVNHPIEVDGRRLVADACWPEARLVVEVDSVAHHGFGASAEHTASRRAALTASGWRVLSVSPARLLVESDAVLREIEAAYLAGLAEAPPERPYVV